MDRRKFLKRLGLAALGSVTAGLGIYPFLEAKWCRLFRQTITVPNLPSAFRGTIIALLADIHHGPFVPLAWSVCSASVRPVYRVDDPYP